MILLKKVINPHMPEPYKYETDYRNIPREYLNPRIPDGRKMEKWLPMATIPLQHEMLNEYISDQNKIEKPILSDDQINEINQKLLYKMFHNPEITLKFYNDGYIDEINGIIHKVDPLKSALYVYESDQLRIIELTNIYYIE
ncbi:YolD-like family protein [Staphylococcus xylosus]|uniref:YolD-like family protein n=1 Tax=Staphylococcus TaxID=1279 RepID=UPI003F55CAD2